MPQLRKNSITLDSVTKRFIQLNDPEPERPPKVELTRAEKENLIKDFKEVMEREPTEEEKETMFVEERKLRGGKGNGKEYNTRLGK